MACRQIEIQFPIISNQTNMIKKQTIIVYFLVFTASIIFGCKKAEVHVEESDKESADIHLHEEGEMSEVTLTSEQFKIAGIEIGKLETRNLTGVVHVNGELDVPPQNLVSVSSPAPGFLQSSDLLEGSRVKKGQVIGVIRNPEFIQMQQDYLETKHQLDSDRSRLEYLEAEYKRQEELARENINAGKTLQLAKADYNSMRSNVSGLEARLGGQRTTLRLIGINVDKLSPENFQSQISIFSPTSGYVMAVNVNAGKYVNNTDVLFQIADTKHLHAELTVFEKDITKLKVGQKVRFMLANESNERTATIYLFAREITEERGIRVHCHLDKEDTELLPGMYFKGVVETGASPVLSLPEDAVVSNEGKDYIFVKVDESKESHGEVNKEESKNSNEEDNVSSEEKQMEEYHFQMIEVKKGITDGDFSEITFLDEFDASARLVVTKGAFSLLSAFKSADEGEEGHAH